jgi:uncharacterized protein YuzB (UPF0349 family)
MSLTRNDSRVGLIQYAMFIFTLLFQSPVFEYCISSTPRFFLKERDRAVGLLKDDSWRWCTLCWSTKFCVVMGRCINRGRKVKAVF